MNISKGEQRALHALAQGGAIHFERGDNGKVTTAVCYSREGHALAGFSFATFSRLLKWRLIRSRGGAPYQITRRGVEAVRAQLDNR